MPREQTKRFFIFVIPSVLSFALAGVYSIVDGFFVGNSIGDIGLSAINVAYPLVALLYVTRGLIGPLFGASEAVSEMIVGCMWIFLLAYIFPFFTRVTTSCFYATEQTVFSYILVYVEPLLLWLSLLTVPRFLGLDGVWWSVLLAQAICFVIAVVLKVISDRKERRPAASVTKER